MKSFLSKRAASVAITAFALTPSIGWACACGCGIFDVGTSSMFPRGPGGMFYINYDFQDQNHNWSGSSKAPAQNNGDKDLRTHFITAGVEYMFNRDWGFDLEVPYDIRYFKGTGGATGNDIVSFNWGTLGDIRLQAIYTGFSPDLSSGVTFGLKLPSGNFTHNDAFGSIDRDSQIGTGSTDLLLGGFHRGNLTRDNSWDWFAQALLDLPVLEQDDYLPGTEIDGALGVYYNAWTTAGGIKIAPLAQIIAAERTSDSGNNASGGQNSPPVGAKNSGYQRILLAPGIEFDRHPWSVYADVELPVYEHVTGNQLVAPVLFKLILTYHF